MPSNPQAAQLAISLLEDVLSHALSADLPPDAITHIKSALDAIRSRRRGDGIKRPRTQRWAKYDFSLVEEARRMRARVDERGKPVCEYKDIAEALNVKYGTNISWITIRDWTMSYYRVRR